MTEDFKVNSRFTDECVKTLQELIRLDTTNPPGNESKAAEFIQKKLENEDLDAEVIESEPERGNVVSRLRGSPENPSLLLIGHLDVVPAGDRINWDIDPFSGELKDGFIWGRGALDMKGSVVAELMAFIKAVREGFKPKGEVIYAGTADEEAGGHRGSRWLLAHPKHLAKFTATDVISEGGGFLLPFKTKSSDFIIEIAEKGVFWTKIRTSGIAGHSSIPGKIKNMSIIKMMTVFDKISKWKPPIRIQNTFRETGRSIDIPGYQKKLLTTKLTLKAIVWLASKLLKINVGRIIFPLVQNKITPTMIHAGEKINNIPGTCEGAIDVRLLPGFDRDDLNKILQKILGKKLFKEIELEPIQSQPGGYTPINTPFYQRINEAINEIEPAKLVPILCPGSTDLRYFRKLGMNAYGFVPMKVDEDLTIREMGDMPHGYNERISVKNLMFATEFFYKLLKKY